MRKHRGRPFGTMVVLAGALFGLSACGPGTTTPNADGTQVTEQPGRAIQLVLALVPGQSTEQDVTGELGEPGGTEEPLAGEWTWLYSLNEDGSSYARVTLDTSSSLRIVKAVEVIQPAVTVAELEAAIGEPDLVYEDLAAEHSVLAYPVLGIEAQVPADPMQPDETVSLLKRGPSQSVQSYLALLEGRPEVRIIKSP